MRVVTFGEILLRLGAPAGTKLFQKDYLDATFCGSEANVAASLAILGLDSLFVTKVPDSPIGRAAISSLDYFKVDTSKVIYGDGRLGLYYLEKGASQRPSRVIYDRAYSSISLSERCEYQWDDIFDNADWFHWSGINPALSDTMSQICFDACMKAREKNLTVSCDLNYRKKLWDSDKAHSVMSKLMPFVDLCICNEEDAEKVLGIKTSDTDISSGQINKEGFSVTAETISNTYGCRYVATTLRKSYSASRNGWSAMLYDGNMKKSYFSREYDIQIVDRIGGGDSFSAGLIYALETGMTPSDALEFATAASCLKHTMEGDYNRSTAEEIQNLLKTGGNGRIQR